MSESMNRDRHRQPQSPSGQKRAAVEMSARRTDDERAPRQEPRQASPIERREWRGAGVCGDRHTD